ncbi:MAG: glucosaminidase domain-containing protein [Bacteroidales bacterium]|jgi:LysM repeat protein|nr:glucosaminidase domain-containing protein [Bacteroidales bacterium]
MLRSIYLFLSLFIILGLVSCSSSRPVIIPSGSEPNTIDYINNYKDIAVTEMKRTGIPASITLAQGMIESDYGRSRLAREANNHFGIKCHSDWKGQTIRHNDDRKNECFRKYARPEDSFYDHSDFLRTGSRYSFLFDISASDYKAWARGLKKAGYATNPDYANMLIRKIELNNLYYFDQGKMVGVLPKAETVQLNQDTSQPAAKNPDLLINPDNGSIVVPVRTQRVMENNRIQYIIVKDGETLKSIEEEFQLLRWELTKYNEISSDSKLTTGQVLYLQPKRDKAEPGKETHTVIEGDTMYSISQNYGVKIKKLYEYNRLSAGEEPAPGDKIWLRMVKPVN